MSRGHLFQAGDIVALPAVHGDFQLFQLPQNRFGVDSQLRILFSGCLVLCLNLMFIHAAYLLNDVLIDGWIQ
jgi:hypothetical protein